MYGHSLILSVGLWFLSTDPAVIPSICPKCPVPGDSVCACGGQPCTRGDIIMNNVFLYEALGCSTNLGHSVSGIEHLDCSQYILCSNLNCTMLENVWQGRIQV